MRVVINYDGKEYRSAFTKEMTSEAAKDIFYDELENLNKFHMELEGGGHLVMPSKAVQLCVIRFLDD